MKLSSFIIFVTFILLIHNIQAYTTGINSVVSSLAVYQTESGGFRATRDAEATLEATSQALFLSSLFGLRDKINSGLVSSFIYSLNNQDHGYSNQVGKQSDLESVRHALLSYTHLGIPISNTAGLGAFIHSLYDRETKLYANNVGATGDLKSTATAFQCLSILNLLQNSVERDKQHIKKILDSLKKTDAKKNHAYFSSITSDNYYAIVVAKYVGVEFGDVQPWANYFIDRQVTTGSLSGGFFSDYEQTEVNPEDAAHALSALYVLQQLTTDSKESLVDAINTEALVEYCAELPRNLKFAANAYTAIARTKEFQNSFKISTTYEVLDNRYRLVGNRIIQGTQVKPVLSMKTTYGLAHAGLDVSVTITHKASGEKEVRKLTWNSELQHYSTDEFYDTGDKLGLLTFDYVIRWLVVDLSDDLTLEISDSKTIGYDLQITSKASHAGKDIRPNEIIGIGTEFLFDIRLGTQKRPKSMLSGDFYILFTVAESSGVTIHEATFDGTKNSAPIKFDYDLSASNIPAGRITFTFSIGNKEGIHTIDSISYVLPVTMVATEINFKGFSNTEVANYKIGETVEVNMAPATLPDLRTVQYYNTQDFSGKPTKRKFYMDVSSSETHGVLFSLKGEETIVGKKPLYIFKLPVGANFNAIGENIVSFHYEAENGERIVLQNYDSKKGELFEDNAQLRYSVSTELHLINVKNSPQSGKLDYGNEVKFTFQIQDEITKKFVFAGSPVSTVYLVLRHKEEGRPLPFISNKQAAEQIRDEKGNPAHFQISWSVNPNAVKGDGYIELIAQGADGQEIPLLVEGKKEQWKINVNIGGKIDISESTFTKQVEEDTIFLVELGLSCQQKKLNDAQLTATVTFTGKKDSTSANIAVLPVTLGTEPGLYQVSWNQDNKEVKSGKYVVHFYRQVDRLRYHGLSPEEIDSKLQPLFDITFSHESSSGSSLPFKTELFTLLSLALPYFWLVYKKMEIDGGKKKVTKKR